MTLPGDELSSNIMHIHKMPYDHETKNVLYIIRTSQYDWKNIFTKQTNYRGDPGWFRVEALFRGQMRTSK
jgi:hypothetical protein